MVRVLGLIAAAGMATLAWLTPAWADGGGHHGRFHGAGPSYGRPPAVIVPGYVGRPFPHPPAYGPPPVRLPAHYPGRGPSVGIVIGTPYYRPYWGPGWYGGSYWGAYPPVVVPPAVVVTPPPPTVYIERPPEPALPATPAAPAAGYWYWCNDPRGWYPDVIDCPQGWQSVTPRPAQ